MPRPALPSLLLRGALPALLLAAPLACGRDRAVSLNGRVEAYLTDLGPRAGGRLVEIRVQEGQRVKQGELLAVVAAEELDAALERDRAGLDSAQAKKDELDHGSRLEAIAQGEARLGDARAALALAQQNLRRVQALAEGRITSQAELDKATAERDRAQAAVDLQSKALAELRAGARREQRAGAGAETRRARAVLDQSRVQASFREVRAPFDGIVIHRLREVGSVLNPGQSVLTLARLDQLWVRVYVPQPLQGRLSQGMELELRLPDGRKLPARLDEVASEAEFTPKMVETAEERVNLVYPARVRVDKGWDLGLLPGLSVTVRVLPRPSR